MAKTLIERLRSVGLRRRLTAFSLVIALVPLFIVGITSAATASATLREQTSSNLENLAAIAQADTQRFLQSRLGDIQVLAQSPILTGFLSTETQKADFLKAVQDAYGIYAALYVTDADGIVIASTDQTGGNQASQQWFQNAKDGKVSATDVYYLTSVQNIVITFSAPIRDGSGKFIGAVAGHVDSRSVFDALTNRKIGETGELSIVNGEGRVVADKHRNIIFTDVSSLAPVREGIQGRAGTISDIDEETGETTLYAYQPLTEVENWIVIAGLPITELNAPINALALRTALVALITALFVLVSIFFITRNIVNPIRQLTGVAERLSQGDYTAEIPVVSLGEVGQLATSFQNMVTAIQDRDKTLTMQNYELQEANRLKDVFLATMSHELRTPLNAIIGFSGIITMGGKLDEGNVQMVQRIRANSERLLALINDILEISRIESGRMVLVRDNVNVVELIEKLEGQMSVLADMKKIKFKTQLAPDVPQAVVADLDAMTKIITNLTSNAIKFTDEGGEVTLALSSAGNELRIEVADTGIGIPAHMHELIFESFRQADSSTTRAYGGSGLGLSIVRQLCGVMNGTVRVQSEVGKGSTFTVELPLEVAN
jgi:signal transduction histidine kinase